MTGPTSINVSQDAITALSAVIRVEDAFADDVRLSFELKVSDYPLPTGLDLSCPITEINLVTNFGQSSRIYRHPDQITLEEYYDLTKNSRWVCEKDAVRPGSADYTFSLIYFYDPASLHPEQGNYTLHVDLDEVLASNAAGTKTLPKIGSYDFLLDFPKRDGLTWTEPKELSDFRTRVELTRVVVNPSFTLLDTCIQMRDNHFWRPMARLSNAEKDYFSSTYQVLSPYPFDRDTTLSSQKRCFSFSIPFQVPKNGPGQFSVGIDHITIDNSSTSDLRLKDCEMVRVNLERLHPGLRLLCTEFETRGQVQHWFVIRSTPPDMNHDEAYALVSSSFTWSVNGPWLATYTGRPSN